MHRCSASSTTPAPRHSSRLSRKEATCWPSSSWTCMRAANASTARASFDRPRCARPAARPPGQHRRTAAGDALPKLIAAAQATRENAEPEERAEASGLLADAYILAADFAVKVNDDPLSWTTSDRALQAAQASGDPLAVADARRAVATAMRRAHHHGRAVDMLLRACRDIEPDGSASPTSSSRTATCSPSPPTPPPQRETGRPP